MSAALAVIGSLASSMLGNMASENAIDRQNYYNRQLMRESQPDYVAQKLRAAGINPAFAYSQMASGAIQTIPQQQTQDTSNISNMGPNAVNAYLSARQSDLLKSEQENQDIQNQYQHLKSSLEVSRMMQEVQGLKYDNYVKNGSKDLQISILKQTEQQEYARTYAQNLLNVGSQWDIATKAMFAKIGLPLEFQKMRNDIANSAAQLSYQLKVNKWYDRFSSAQIDSLYSNAAAALIQAHSAERNSYINQYLAPSQKGSFDATAENQRSSASSTRWQTSKDKQLFPLVKQSLKIGVDESQQNWDYNNSSKFNNFMHRSLTFVRSHSPINFSISGQ